MKKATAFILLLLLSYTMLLAQEKTISGIVSDKDSPLPGVNVLVKGTKKGTVTDMNGSFKILVSDENDILVLSFIGYKSKEVKVGNQTNLKINLELDTEMLEEVVVTAQGIVKTRNELTYSAQKIEGDAINNARSSNFVNSLSGRVAGLNVKKSNTMGGSTNVVMRGYSSLNGDNQALFIIDGVPIDNRNTSDVNTTIGRSNQAGGRGGYDYGNSAADLNPDDIESINVLKGAAATVLYGSRAANGVILITTKKGKANKGIGVTVNLGHTIGKIDKSTFPDYQKSYGSGYGTYYEDASGYFLERDIDGDGTPDLVVPPSEDASHGAPFDPSLMVYHWDAFDPASPNYGQKRPWVAAANDPSSFFQTAKQSNISVMLDGQTEKGYFKFGYTKNNETGVLPNSEINKDYINFAASYNITPKLSASASINLTNVSGLGRYGTGYDDKNLMSNFRQWWQVNVDIKEQEEAYFRNRKNVTWNWVDPSDLSPIYWDNPYFTRYENYQNDSRLRYFGYTTLSYKVNDWLSLAGRASIDSYTEMQEERQAVTSVTTSNYSRFNHSFKEYNYNFVANFNKKINDNFSITGLLGTNSRLAENESVFAQTNGGLVLPGLYNLGNSVNPIEPPFETFDQLKVIGFFGNASFSYRNFLNLEFSLRRDYSSALPADNNHFDYPAISGSFVFSELIGSGPILTGGIIRANYAEIGNGGLPQRLTDVYRNTVSFGSIPKYSIPDQKNNPDLVEERTKSFELGLEMSFLDGKVGFDLSYYDKKSFDQILPVYISRASGYDSKLLNAGTMVNKGFELMLFAKPINTKKFSWNININWTKNDNEITELPTGIDNLQLGTFQGGVSINAPLGGSYGTIRGSDFIYDENGNKVVNESGYYKKTTTSNNVIGEAQPDWLMGISNSLNYKNLSLSFLVDIRKGGDVFNLDMNYGLATGLYPETAGMNDLGNPLRNSIDDGGGIVFDGVKEVVDGDNNITYVKNDIRYDSQNFGAFGYRRNPAKAFVYDASYVKLRELAITYSVPQNIVAKVGAIKSIDLSVVGTNLWIIHKNVPYADPEASLGSGNTASGYQGGTYPSTRTLGFNVKMKF